MKHRLPSLFVVALIPFLGGCVGKTVRLAHAGYDKALYEPVGNATGSASGIQILGAIPINMVNRIARATEQAIKSVEDGEELANVKIKESGRYFFFVNVHKVEVEGVVIKRKQ